MREVSVRWDDDDTCWLISPGQQDILVVESKCIEGKWHHCGPGHKKLLEAINTNERLNRAVFQGPWDEKEIMCFVAEHFCPPVARAMRRERRLRKMLEARAKSRRWSQLPYALIEGNTRASFLGDHGDWWRLSYRHRGVKQAGTSTGLCLEGLQIQYGRKHRVIGEWVEYIDKRSSRSPQEHLERLLTRVQQRKDDLEYR